MLMTETKSRPFFGSNNATLGVTGQLHAESYAVGFEKVYTFAPTFRAEHSNTKKTCLCWVLNDWAWNSFLWP